MTNNGEWKSMESFPSEFIHPILPLNEMAALLVLMHKQNMLGGEWEEWTTNDGLKDAIDSLRKKSFCSHDVNGHLVVNVDAINMSKVGWTPTALADGKNNTCYKKENATIYPELMDNVLMYKLYYDDGEQHEFTYHSNLWDSVKYYDEAWDGVKIGGIRKI